jgi:hypothetical protein
MVNGALLMMDALGFKGIWKRHAPDAVLRVLRQMREDLDTTLFEAQVQARRSNALQTYRTELLSDTVVVGVSMKRHGDQPSDLFGALYTAAGRASHIMRMASVSEVPLAYRGCIAVGEFHLEERFIVGPAVDQAAACMNEAEGAFVWTTPAAHRVFVEGRHRIADVPDPTIVPYAVPLKGGRLLKTMAISPFHSQDPMNTRDDIIARIAGTFGQSDALDIEHKKQQTLAFLQQVGHDSSRFFDDPRVPRVSPAPMR